MSIHSAEEEPSGPGVFLFLGDVYSSHVSLSTDFLDAGSPAFRRPSDQARDLLTMGTFHAARPLPQDEGGGSAGCGAERDEARKECTVRRGKLISRRTSVPFTCAEKRHSGLKLEVAHPICNGIIPRVAALMT